MSATDSPRVGLNDGNTIPQLGFGMFKVEPDEAERIAGDALDVGYRHIDTAKVYGNEAAVGRAIAASGIPREELFVTTKLYNSDHGYERSQGALPRSLARLGLDYVDLYLIHWPAPARGLAPETWRAMVEQQAEGLARSIGVCNFHAEHLEHLLASTDVVPAVNQIELHPAFQRHELRAFCEQRGIKVEAWGPLGQGKYPLSELDGLQAIADEHGKSVQQVVLRWHMQEGIITFPKTVRKERMVENADIFDFELSSEQIAHVAALDRDMRVGPHPDERNGN